MKSLMKRACDARVLVGIALGAVVFVACGVDQAPSGAGGDGADGMGGFRATGGSSAGGSGMGGSGASGTGAGGTGAGGRGMGGAGVGGNGAGGNGAGGRGTGGNGGVAGSGMGGRGTGGNGAGGSGMGGRGMGGNGVGGSAGCPTTSGPPGALPATPWLHVEGNQIKDPNGNVVILRGVDFPDLGDLQFWEGGINTMIDRVTNASDTQGCSPSWQPRVLRLAVLPADFGTTPAQYQPGGTYYASILRPTVDYARSKGMYVIIDWHYIDDTTKHEATTTQFWTDIAPRFAGDSNVLFELFNEPVNGGDWTTVKPDMQSWYNIVHAGAPNNLVLVGTPNWCQNVGTAAASPLQGTNIIYVVHMYPLHWAQLANRSQVQMAAALAPVFMSEWGFQQGDGSILDGTITSYGAPFKQFVEDQKLSWSAWCASTTWQPTMFATGSFSLNTGEGQMGGFAKDWLYEKRTLDQPSP